MDTRKNIISDLIIFFSLSASGTAVLAETEFSGTAALDLQYFPETALVSTQHSTYLSGSFEPEFHRRFNNSDSSVLFTPFIRLDQHDENKTHTDIRELYWQKIYDSFELRAGISKVFWGATESQHLVDIINQTDLVENFDGEDKLGQPMLKLSFEKDWGNFDFFILPYFRQRTFTGEEGRLGYGLPVDDKLTQYESSDEEKHIDFALRFFTSRGNWDIGLSYFDGTSRDPVLIPTFNSQSQLVLSPYYPLIQQTGLDLTGTIEDWIWKLEVIQRNSDTEDYNALTGGYEYTFYGVNDSAIDIGLVNEYLYDSRDTDVTTPFQNDLMFALRIIFNNEDSTEILAGAIIDLDTQSQIFSIEGSQRFSDNIKAELEIRVFSDIDSEDLIYSIRNDDYLRLTVAYFY